MINLINYIQNNTAEATLRRIMRVTNTGTGYINSKEFANMLHKCDIGPALHNIFGKDRHIKHLTHEWIIIY